VMNDLHFRYSSLVEKYIDSPEKKVTALKMIAHFWQKSEQHIVITVNRFLTYKIVDSIAVVNWIFSPEQQQKFTR
jgi:hypothetical protein